MAIKEAILLRDVDRLGKKWQRVKVRRGYFQNFLLPRGLAILADREGLRFLEERKAREEKREERDKAQALEFSRKIEKIVLEVKVRTGEGGKLFGSVTAADLEGALKAQGILIDRKQFEWGEPIKKLGDYVVKVRLHGGVESEFRVKVTSS